MSCYSPLHCHAREGTASRPRQRVPAKTRLPDRPGQNPCQIRIELKRKSKPRQATPFLVECQHKALGHTSPSSFLCKFLQDTHLENYNEETWSREEEGRGRGRFKQVGIVWVPNEVEVARTALKQSVCYGTTRPLHAGENESWTGATTAWLSSEGPSSEQCLRWHAYTTTSPAE
jgi:hypothetical protein